jgi:hypothetical protein
MKIHNFMSVPPLNAMQNKECMKKVIMEREYHITDVLVTFA